ncbi:MAG: T9SS type A sorting domain-containing protein [Bacteroidota bacterium]
MNKVLAIGILCLLAVGCAGPGEQPLPKEQKEEPGEYLFKQRAFPRGEIRTDAFAQAVSWKKRQKWRLRTGMWEFVGPQNVGGRITDVEIPIDQMNTYYFGTASGGIFKTDDGGENWSPIFDETGFLSIGDIEISRQQTNTLWVGTGEVNAGGGSLAYDGGGVYKSEDGGLSWEHKGLPNVGSIGKVLIDPNDGDIVFVAAMGPLFRNDSNRGVYRTKDGGESWEKVLFVNDSTGVIDMAIHPTDGNIIYAASWERIRRPQYRKYGGEGTRLYRSTDGGDNWEELTLGLPSDPLDKGRISIAISESNPQVLYARYADASGSIQGVYRTANGGDGWLPRNSSQLNNVGFHWWFRGIYVDPTDENTLYNVDFIVEKSTNGANSWESAFRGVHVDQHALAFNRMRDGEVLLGNDGGLYKSEDAGLSQEKFANLPITQFYRFHVDSRDEDRVYGGTQDNGTVRTITGSEDDWRLIYNGDGFQPLVADDSGIIYALFQYGGLGRSVDDGLSFQRVASGQQRAERSNWDSPLLLNPQNNSSVYFGTQRLWKSTDEARTWAAISPDLTNGDGGGNLTYGTLTSIDVSPLDSNRIIVGTDDANIWITQDGGDNWDKVSTGLPKLWTTKVLADRQETDVYYVTFSGYRYGQDNGHIFKTTDAGLTWTGIGGDLPDVPVNDILKDKYGQLYIATDIGVFYSMDEGDNWFPFGENMPTVVVTDLHIHEETNVLYAATYGRSAYKIPINEPTVSTNYVDLSPSLILSPNPTSDRLEVRMPSAIANAQVEIYDSYGRVVYTAATSGETHELTVSHLASGMYHVRVSAGEKGAIQKLMIQ